MNKLNLIVLSVTLLVLSACTNNSNKTDAEQNNSDTLAYTIKTFNKNFVDRNDTTSIRIEYPLFDENNALGKALNDSILKGLYVLEDDTAVKTVQQFGQKFIQDYISVAKEDTMYAMPWYYEGNAKVENNTPSLVSISTAYDVFTGGAHGSHVWIYSNFDKKTGEKISLNQLFNDANDKNLLTIGESYFRKARGLDSKASLKDEGLFAWNEEGKEGIFYFTDNFLIGKDSITFFYNEYEIAAYAFGPTDMKIPISELKPYLKSSYGF